MPSTARMVLLAVCSIVLIVAMTAKSFRGAAAVVGAWLVPGAGHAFLGRWKKGLLFFALLIGTYLAGLWICGWRMVSFDDNPWYYVGQFGSGLTTLVGQVLEGEKAYPVDSLPSSWFDPGLLYVCIAGLLNLVITLNVPSVLEKQPAPPEPPP